MAALRRLMMQRYWLGIGANIGNPEEQMSLSISYLNSHLDVTVESVAPLYRTPPWGKTDQPHFLNSALSVSSSLVPLELLDFCKSVEMRLDRRPGERWGPRPIDLDIIAWGGGGFVSDRLELPHPRAAERGFVLVPLVDIAPDLELDGATVAELAARADCAGISMAEPTGWHQSDGNRGGDQL
ncbi:MAG: 2-amino-4-hydroxy-6-hydroxymethyldihydropteridine diphosphokinase [Pseudomonadota bacterium]